MPTQNPPAWTRRFEVPYLLTARPARGSDLALLVYDEATDARGVVADLVTGSRSDELPFPVTVESTVTPDGEWVLRRVDESGSEIGHVWAYPVSGGSPLDLTPDRSPYVMRGLDVSADGRSVLLTIVDEQGFHALLVPVPWGSARCLYSSRHEAWWGCVAADGSLASIDTTDHGPGVRRTAVTVVDAASAEVVAVLNDLPDGPVRARRFSEVPRDPRLLVCTERTGFVRPAIWNPLTGERRDYVLPELDGEVLPVDWSAATGRILAVHIRGGVQTVLTIDVESGTYTTVSAQDGSYVDPDVGSIFPFVSGSFCLPDGSTVLARSRWDIPLHLVRVTDGATATVVEPADVPAGRRLDSVTLTSRDGTGVQLWAGFPDRPDPRGTVLEVHGGPNLVTVDGYSPSAQAWLDEGFVYASLNYRGSVTFGQRFREGFWGVLGERELEDIDAAVTWLRRRGVATPESTFITGASYGGFLTLFAVGRLPGRFAGGLAHVAMADWRASFSDQNPAQRNVWLQWLGGEPDELEERITRYSPITYVDRVTASVWLNQGSFDTRTPADQAQKYADELAAAGGDVVIDWFDDGHEPVGLAYGYRVQERMLDLAGRTLRGERWAA